MSKRQQAFGITMAKGFHLNFPNGYTISTQFGGGNYCTNYDDPIERPNRDVFSNLVEIAIWNVDGKLITSKAHKAITGKVLENEVEGWVSIKNWKKYLDWVASRRKTKEEDNGNA